MTYSNSDTIAAICTAPGPAGLAAIRICGKEAIAIAEKIFSKPLKELPSHTAHYGKILDEKGRLIDKAMLLLLHSPKTYTGEETVEIFSHGGTIIPKKILESLLQAGARAARPGEFTLRAFLNGKIDLAQAEAVEERVASQNEMALQASMDHLEGKLSKKIGAFQKELVAIGAILEAWVDFPEEDLAFATMEEICEKIICVIEQMQKLSYSFENGKRLKEGATICLIGAPNVGKSSLMNHLLGKERAIVTSIAGTTRDTLEEDVIINKLPLRIIDTAGLRETEELIEKEGIKRSKKAQKKADLLLCIFDACKGLSKEEKKILADTNPEKTLYLFNKIDLLKELPWEAKAFPYPFLAISAKEGTNCDLLMEEIQKRIFLSPVERGEILLTSLRHKSHLDNAISYCEKVVEGLKNDLSAEFVSSDMRKALQELGYIIGMNVTEEILSSIFSKFCVGK